jgi:hypothetical protein
MKAAWMCVLLTALPTLAVADQNKPPLSMRESIKIVEQYLASKKIDVSDKFLSSARYDRANRSRERSGMATIG